MVEDLIVKYFLGGLIGAAALGAYRVLSDPYVDTDTALYKMAKNMSLYTGASLMGLGILYALD
ncbi:MAG: hypothetical protein JW727_03855 [Candidatus Aenigmarchaeota archaeon]|nr:hypothetical protein [Candidatus Aenigmarchaeota archaeon]